MSKFDVRICKCGHIHFIDDAEINAALKANKNILLICGNCGKATLIGADIEHDWYDPTKTCYNMYSFDMGYSDFFLTPENFTDRENHKSIMKVIYSKGKDVPMMTGMNATHYFAPAGRFEDSWYLDFWKIEHPNVTVPDIMEFIETWRKERVTVNMKRLIQELTYDEAKALSGYLIKGLNWDGTEFAKKK